MRPLLLLAASASLFATLPAWADSRQAERVWTQEPSSFLGVDLQGDFLQQVAECPTDETRPTEPCRVATADPSRFEIHGLPYLPISPGYNLVATLADGQVRELVFSGNANSLHLVTDMLTERFGEPAERNSQWVKMKSGASYLTEVMNWKGDKVAINFQRQENDLGKYAVTFSTLPTELATSTEAPAADVVEADVSKI